MVAQTLSRRVKKITCDWFHCKLLFHQIHFCQGMYGKCFIECMRNFGKEFVVGEQSSNWGSSNYFATALTLLSRRIYRHVEFGIQNQIGKHRLKGCQGCCVCTRIESITGSIDGIWSIVILDMKVNVISLQVCGLSNTHLRLRELTGVTLGPVIVTVGISISTHSNIGTNDAILNLIHLMWGSLWTWKLQPPKKKRKWIHSISGWSPFILPLHRHRHQPPRMETTWWSSHPHWKPQLLLEFAKKTFAALVKEWSQRLF